MKMLFANYQATSQAAQSQPYDMACSVMVDSMVPSSLHGVSWHNSPIDDHQTSSSFIDAILLENENLLNNTNLFSDEEFFNQLSSILDDHDLIEQQQEQQQQQQQHGQVEFVILQKEEEEEAVVVEQQAPLINKLLTSQLSTSSVQSTLLFEASGETTCFDLNSIMNFIESNVVHDECGVPLATTPSNGLKRKSVMDDDEDSDSMESYYAMVSSPATSTMSSSSSDDTASIVSTTKRRKNSNDSVNGDDMMCEDGKEFKKHLNKQAAIRYRQKKNKEKETLFHTRDMYEEENKELKKKIDDIQVEINFVKNILVEMLLKKNIFSKIETTATATSA